MSTKIPPAVSTGGNYYGIKSVIPFAVLYIFCIILFSLKYSSPFNVIRISSASTLVFPATYF